MNQDDLTLKEAKIVGVIDALPNSAAGNIQIVDSLLDAARRQQGQTENKFKLEDKIDEGIIAKLSSALDNPELGKRLYEYLSQRHSPEEIGKVIGAAASLIETPEKRELFFKALSEHRQAIQSEILKKIIPLVKRAIQSRIKATVASTVFKLAAPENKSITPTYSSTDFQKEATSIIIHLPPEKVLSVCEKIAAALNTIATAVENKKKEEEKKEKNDIRLSEEADKKIKNNIKRMAGVVAAESDPQVAELIRKYTTEPNFINEQLGITDLELFYALHPNIHQDTDNEQKLYNLSQFKKA